MMILLKFHQLESMEVTGAYNSYTSLQIRGKPATNPSPGANRALETRRGIATMVFTVLLIPVIRIMENFCNPMVGSKLFLTSCLSWRL